MIQGKTAEILYKEIAKNAPIYDYHCHLSAKEIYEDKVFEDISALWLKHDHYKWRVMRYAGVPEKYITGDADNLEKFRMWAKVCQRLIGSPLYHWANMELETYFGVDELLTEANAERIYHICNKQMKTNALSPVKTIGKSNVKLICTTDDPVDTLEYHKLLALKEDLDFCVLPTFRPDRAMNILNEGFPEYLRKLSECCNLNIESFKDLMGALRNRMAYFQSAGCKISDHSLESLSSISAGEAEVEEILSKRLKGKPVSQEEAEKYKNLTLKLLASEYRKKGWVMQLHLGAMRNTNEVMFNQLGVDAGYDIMNDFQIAAPLAGILNQLNNEGGLPKTIIYSLNSKDNLVLSSIPHCFSEDGVPGKIQFGAAWWFNDHKGGIDSHLRSIANQGMLAYFVGMLTDSRSLLSYARHDYFRRILCSFVGNLVDSGEFGQDDATLKEIVEGICYKNLKRYLGMGEMI